MQEQCGDDAAGHLVLAYDKRRGAYLGTVAELSADQLVLLSCQSLQADQLLELELIGSDQQPDQGGMMVNARVLWSDPQAGTCWAEMRFIALNEPTRRRLRQLRTPTHREARRGDGLTA